MRIALVAGEVSGDLLGARLIQSLRIHWPNATFEGIGGAEMQAQGFDSLYPLDRLSVMGFVEVLSRLRELLAIRKSLIRRWRDDPPDLFVGIDAPDFNLGLEKKLHHTGIPAIHYVSPSIWAWRQGRVKKMTGNLDLMLTLFPFEVDFYQQHGVPAVFVGHPLADEVPQDSNRAVARKKLGLDETGFVLALLPGSRQGELRYLAKDFLLALHLLHQKHPDWQFVVPLVNPSIRVMFNEIKQRTAPDLPLIEFDGQSRLVMTAANQIVMASGTAVLEGMLINRPMVAAYRVAPLTAKMIRFFRMIKSPFYTLPNNLASEKLVPELIQEAVTADALAAEVEQQFSESTHISAYREKRFRSIHEELRQNASQQAARAITHFMQGRSHSGSVT